MMPRLVFLFAALALPLAACDGQPADPDAAEAPAGAPGKSEDTAPWSGIAQHETVEFTGTEPFWGGESSGASLTYRTPDNIDGETIAVERFAGRNGISLAGELDGQPFDMAITPGECSDGMSDRSYPFTVTLQVHGEQRRGCAWTGRRPFTGSENP